MKRKPMRTLSMGAMLARRKVKRRDERRDVRKERRTRADG
jgi:hypothetical protein